MRRKSRIDHKILDGYLTRETSHLIAEEVKALSGTMRITVEDLVNHLLPWAAGKAVVPVSKFKVGAVCRGNSGNLYFGANIEFANQPLHFTIHAEQSSIANAMFHGETGVKALSVTAAPCGHCRQFLNELNSAHELKINLPGDVTFRLPDLLPESFGPKELEIPYRLFDAQAHQLTLENGSGDPIVQKAVDAANTSYAPYSSSYAGVAIQTRNGQEFSGVYMENAAYNPSVLPLQACLSNILMAGRSYGDIARVVLVVKKGSPVNHARVAKELLQTILSVELQVFEAV